MFFFLMIRRPPRSTLDRSSAASDVYKRQEQASSLTLAAHQGVMDDPPCLHHSVRVGECLCGLAVLQQQIVISKDSSNDPRHMRHWPNMPHHQDICLPIKARGKVLGTLNVRVPPHRQMEQRELDLLNAVTDQMGVAIENAQLFEAVNRPVSYTHLTLPTSDLV